MLGATVVMDAAGATEHRKHGESLGGIADFVDDANGGARIVFRDERHDLVDVELGLLGPCDGGHQGRGRSSAASFASIRAMTSAWVDV
jgi:hypothetical protein